MVYGVVALIVKADDIGLHLAETGSGPTRSFGRGLVKGTPVLLQALTVIGTAAMLWVGGSIIIHGLAEFGFHGPEHLIEHAATMLQQALGVIPAVVAWVARSFLQAVLGIAVGAVIVLAFGLFKPKKSHAT